MHTEHTVISLQVFVSTTGLTSKPFIISSVLLIEHAKIIEHTTTGSKPEYQFNHFICMFIDKFLTFNRKIISFRHMTFQVLSPHPYRVVSFSSPLQGFRWFFSSPLQGGIFSITPSGFQMVFHFHFFFF